MNRNIIILPAFLCLPLIFQGCIKNNNPFRNTVKIESRYPNGNLKERYHIVKDRYGNPVKHGKYVARFENGRISSESTYINGEKNGRETFWYENGKIKREILHRNGPAAMDVIF